MPIGTSEVVAVVTVTDSVSAQSDERASPLNPKVATEARSSNEESLEV